MGCLPVRPVCWPSDWLLLPALELAKAAGLLPSTGRRQQLELIDPQQAQPGPMSCLMFEIGEVQPVPTHTMR
jgi:hypothetical protein